MLGVFIHKAHALYEQLIELKKATPLSLWRYATEPCMHWTFPALCMLSQYDIYSCTCVDIYSTFNGQQLRSMSHCTRHLSCLAKPTLAAQAHVRHVAPTSGDRVARQVLMHIDNTNKSGGGEEWSSSRLLCCCSRPSAISSSAVMVEFPAHMSPVLVHAVQLHITCLQINKLSAPHSAKHVITLQSLVIMADTALLSAFEHTLCLPSRHCVYAGELSHAWSLLRHP